MEKYEKNRENFEKKEEIKERQRKSFNLSFWCRSTGPEYNIVYFFVDGYYCLHPLKQYKKYFLTRFLKKFKKFLKKINLDRKQPSEGRYRRLFFRRFLFYCQKRGKQKIRN